jgi:hypothetical protein
MTAKRYQKLLRAYMTRLNEAGRDVEGRTRLPMGRIYKTIMQNPQPKGMTRAEWWEKFTSGEYAVTFGVGVKAK